MYVIMYVSLTKVFDTVNRAAIWKTLGKLVCPAMFTDVLRHFHEDMKALQNQKP